MLTVALVGPIHVDDGFRARVDSALSKIEYQLRMDKLGVQQPGH